MARAAKSLDDVARLLLLLAPQPEDAAEGREA